MAVRRLGQWEISYDKKATSEFYADYHRMIDACGCAYCKNYVKAVPELPRGLLDILHEFGIDPMKEAEVYQCMENEDGTHLYGGFYHLVGEIITGNDCWVEVGKETKSDGGFISFGDYSVGFTADVALVPDSFPRPVIQMEFEVNIPWKLK